MTLAEVQARLTQAEHSIKTLTAALEAERERARDRMTVWDYYAAAACASLAGRMDWPADVAARQAAHVADAMLAERAKRAAPADGMMVCSCGHRGMPSIMPKDGKTQCTACAAGLGVMYDKAAP